MHARALLALADGDSTVGAEPSPIHQQRPRIPPMLHRYAQGDAFVARTSGGRVYLDDNGWVALAQAQDRAGRHHPPLSDAAVRRATRLRDAVDSSGGVEWFVGGGALHACSTGSIGTALAVVADQVEGAAGAAARCSHFLREILTDEDGIVSDHVNPDGRRDPTRWVYNQGLAVRLDAALAGGVRDNAYADSAEATYLAGRTVFQGEALWAQPVAFVAVWFRALVALAALRPDATHDGMQDLRAYAQRLGAHLRHDPGALASPTSGGPGRYENGASLVVDLAASVQVLALAELPRESFTQVV
jgi:hypothetical protein